MEDLYKESEKLVAKILESINIKKIEKYPEKISHEIITKCVYRYAIPLLEINNNIKESVIYLQSLIIVYTVFLDYYFDNEPKMELYSILQKIFSEITLILLKNYGEKKTKKFLLYSYENNYYMIYEKQWDCPYNYQKKYLGQNQINKVIIAMFVPLEIINDSFLSNCMSNYYRYMLFIDDVVDYTRDIEEKVLTYVNCIYGRQHEIDYQECYPEYEQLYSNLSHIPSKIIQKTKKEIDFEIRKKFF